MQRQSQAYLYGLATVLLWSTVASAFKLALRHLDPLQLLLSSSIVSTLALATALAVRGQLASALGSIRTQLRRSAVLGFLNPFLYYVVVFEAYDRLPAQEAQPLNYTWALTLALLSIPLLKQRLLLSDLAAGLICYSGVLVIATRGEVASLRFSDPVGVALALGSTLVWALYWIYNTRDELDPVVRLFYNFLLGLPYILVACALFSTLSLGGLPGLLGAAYVGLIEMGIAFVLWLTALRLAENTSRVGNLIFLSPFISLVPIHFLVGEDIYPSTLVGLVLIVSGLTVQRLGASRRPPAA
ncbi:DMT family transporter [Candidatus Latescibacterota bacterium]